MTKMKMVVSGKVTRAVIVEGKTLAECEANAISEWASLLGGDYTTAEILNRSYIKEIKRDEEETEDWFLAEKSYEEYFNEKDDEKV